MVAAARFPWRWLLAVLAVALCARTALLMSGAVSFHADESVVALMARHINQGARPTFFYGQPYMGSLDAWLIAVGFRLLGESVLTVRLVQSALYLLVVASGFAVAWRLYEKRVVAIVAGLALAVPTVNGALYTTATLGGYNELLLLGNLVVLLGFDVTHEHGRSWWRWLLLGLCAGLGWWTHALIVIYALPVALLILQTLRARRALPLQYLALAAVSFIIGSAPWWVFDLTHNGAALSMFLTNRQSGEFEGIGIPYVPPAERALGLLVIGLPTLIGMRFPWESSYFLAPVGVIVALIYGVALFRLARGHNPLKPGAQLIVLGIPVLFIVVFIASTFGADPTGRYFLPLALPLGIALGALVDDVLNRTSARARHASPLRRFAAFAIPMLVIGYHAAGQISAARSATGLTTQFDLISHIPNHHDAALIAFLDEHGLYHGYTNYWVAFRLAFLSGERMQFRAALPYKENLSYNAADERYEPYVQATDAAERVAYITTKLPELDQGLQASFEQQGLTYQTERIGLFTIYYDFEPSRPDFP